MHTGELTQLGWLTTLSAPVPTPLEADVLTAQQQRQQQRWAQHALQQQQQQQQQQPRPQAQSPAQRPRVRRARRASVLAREAFQQQQQQEAASSSWSSGAFSDDESPASGRRTAKKAPRKGLHGKRAKAAVAATTTTTTTAGDERRRRRRSSKPPQSVVQLVRSAFAEAVGETLTCDEICESIKQQFPYYRCVPSAAAGLALAVSSTLVSDCQFALASHHTAAGHAWTLAKDPAAASPCSRKMRAPKSNSAKAQRRRYRQKQQAPDPKQRQPKQEHEQKQGGVSARRLQHFGLSLSSLLLLDEDNAEDGDGADSTYGSDLSSPRSPSAPMCLASPDDDQWLISVSPSTDSLMMSVGETAKLPASDWDASEACSPTTGRPLTMSELEQTAEAFLYAPPRTEDFGESLFDLLAV